MKDLRGSVGAGLKISCSLSGSDGTQGRVHARPASSTQPQLQGPYGSSSLATEKEDENAALLALAGQVCSPNPMDAGVRGCQVKTLKKAKGWRELSGVFAYLKSPREIAFSS